MAFAERDSKRGAEGRRTGADRDKAAGGSDWRPAMLGVAAAAPAGALQSLAGNRVVTQLLGPPTVQRVFTDPNNLANHYQKHVVDQAEYGNIDKARYDQMSTDLWQKRGQLQSKPSSDGRVLVYDSKANNFGVFTPRGKAVTMFKPKRRQRYYDEQV